MYSDGFIGQNKTSLVTISCKRNVRGGFPKNPLRVSAEVCKNLTTKDTKDRKVEATVDERG